MYDARSLDVVRRHGCDLTADIDHEGCVGHDAHHAAAMKPITKPQSEGRNDPSDLWGQAGSNLRGHASVSLPPHLVGETTVFSC
jgi:hypothetical protein